MGEFDQDTAVTPAGPFEYAATVTDRWNALGGRPNGGYLLGIALRALGTDMPLPDPISVTSYFLRPATVGPATIRTELTRAGRRIATGEATVAQNGTDIARVIASYADLEKLTGRTVLFNEPPALPAPEDCVDRADIGAPPPGVTIADRVQARFAEPPGWMVGKPAGLPRSEFWMRLADGAVADPVALAALVDTAPPATTDLGVMGSTTLELTVHLRGRPAPGWLACRVSTRHITGGLADEDFEIWDSTGRLVAQSRQLALLP